MNAPLVTVWLVILNSVVWVAQFVLGDRPLLRFALWPLGEHLLPLADGRSLAVGFAPYQLLSYGFLHADLWHLAVNLLGLVLFGPLIERCMGTAHFAFYYAACLVAGALAQLLFLADASLPAATIGASGAVFGLLAAAALLYPQRPVVLFPIPLRLSTRAVALILGAAALLQGALGSNAGVAHFVHLGGMFGGLLLVQYWRGKLPLKPARYLQP